MYIPPRFQATDRRVAFDLIEDIRLGTLVSHHSAFDASHIPFLVDRDAAPHGELIGHCARANTQWPAFADGPDVLVSFLGSNTYVSPSWYTTAPRAPTWLYAAVQVRGRIRLVTDPAPLRDIIVATCDTLEPAESGWRVHDIPDYVDRLLPGIVGFRIAIADIQTQLRLAQQNAAPDRASVLATLQRGGPDQQQVADLITRYAADDTAER